MTEAETHLVLFSFINKSEIVKLELSLVMSDCSWVECDQDRLSSLTVDEGEKGTPRVCIKDQRADPGFGPIGQWSGQW